MAVRNRMFETLDPSSRRLRFPREREGIITDTVGFIRDLPEDLMEAFAATLEELHDADLLLHVIDATSPRMEDQIKTVEQVLEKLDLTTKPVVLVLNKADLLDPQDTTALEKRTGGVAVSAIHPPTLFAAFGSCQGRYMARGDQPSDLKGAPFAETRKHSHPAGYR